MNHFEKLSAASKLKILHTRWGLQVDRSQMIVSHRIFYQPFCNERMQAKLFDGDDIKLSLGNSLSMLEAVKAE